MLSNISTQNNPLIDPPKNPPPAPPPPKIMPLSKAINQMDLTLSNDYRSLKSLEQMIKTNPEKVIPPGDAPRLLQEVTSRIRKMKGKPLSSIVRPEGLQKNTVFLIFEDGKIDGTLGEISI